MGVGPWIENGSFNLTEISIVTSLQPTFKQFELYKSISNTNNPESPLYIADYSEPNMFGQLARRSLGSVRNFSTSVARRGGDGLPPPGDNLPFSINNR